MPDEQLINNAEVAGLCRRLNRFWLEMRTANSANGQDMLDADKARLESYIDATERFLDWIVAAPQIDLPETGGRRKYNPGETPAVDQQQIENEDLRDILNAIAICHDELVHSTSAKMPTGVNKHDEARLRSYIAKGRNFIANYLNPTEPLDMPESSPSQPEAGTGN